MTDYKDATRTDYKNATLPVDQRVALLMREMTLEEKVGQLGQHIPGWTAYKKEGTQITITDSIKKAISNNEIGLIYGVLRSDPWSGTTLEKGLHPAESPRVTNALQKHAKENTRLGIPLLFSEETPHGHMSIGSTIFPVALAMASTWNTELIECVGAAEGCEIRSRGANIGYGPVLDLARDPRWSRCEETFGEDPCLTSRMGEAMVRGLQGRELAQLSGHDKVVSTLKHFAGYGQTEGGKNGSPMHCGEHELREMHLTPFRHAIAAGALSVMAAYHEVDGIACHANRKLLTDILRGEWGFQGFVVADWGAIEMLFRGWEDFSHRHASDMLDAARLAITAGVDASLGGAGGTAEGPEEFAFSHLVAAVKAGKLPEAVIDQACARVLRVKFLLGLFENPYVPETLTACVGSAEHRELATEVARQGLVLLKNEGNLLPLRKAVLKTIAVIGPNADHAGNQLGDYVSPQLPGQVVTVLEGIRRAAGADVTVNYAHGCSVKGQSTAEIEAAVDCAQAADVAVVVLGGSSCRDTSTVINEHGQAVPTASGEMDCGEGYDRDELNLSGQQEALVRAVQATGTPVVVVLIQGRAHSIEWLAENVPAILCAWYPGQNGGTAIAETLFGDSNPAGRLPVSIPRSAANLPVYYNKKKMALRGYVFNDGSPRYPFGFGLSYSTFAYGELRLSATAIRPGGNCVASVEVTNTGTRDGDEVVQLYLCDIFCSRTRPEKELKAFRRVRIAAGATQTVSFEINEELLACHTADMSYAAEPGTFRIMVGPDSQRTQEARLELGAAMV